MRVLAQQQLLLRGQPGRDVLDRGPRAEQGQPPGAGEHRGPGRLPRLEQPDVNGGPGVHQRRVRRDLAVREHPRQLAERPLGQPLADQRAGPGRQRGPQPGPELTLQLRQVLAGGQDLRPARPAASVGHPEVDPQVRRQLPGVELLGRHPDAAQPQQLTRQHLGDLALRGLSGGIQRGEHLPGHVGGGDQLAAPRLGQGPDQLGDQFLAQARDLPGELLGPRLVERRERDVDGDPVGLAARRELIRDRQCQHARSSRSRRLHVRCTRPGVRGCPPGNRAIGHAPGGTGDTPFVPPGDDCVVQTSG